MKKYCLLLCLALFMFSCSTKKPPVKELPADSTVKSPMIHKEIIYTFEPYQLSNPVRTSEIIDSGILLTGKQLKRFVPEYNPKATYRYLGFVNMALLRGYIIQENTVNKKAIFLMMSTLSRQPVKYKRLLHLQKNGDVIYKSILGGAITEIIARYHFGETNKLEIFKNYPDPAAAKPLTILPLLDEESGIATGKAAIAKLLAKLNMDKNWIIVNKEFTGSYPDFVEDAKKWVISPCQHLPRGEEKIFVIAPEEYPFPHKGIEKYIPVHIFSHHDTSVWEITAVAFSDYGNRLILELNFADQLLGYSDAFRSAATMEYLFKPEAGIRVTNNPNFHFALTHQARLVLRKSPQKCPEGPW